MAEDYKITMDPAIYRMMAEQTVDYALFALDAEGRIATWNRGAERIKGYAPEEIIGRHFSVFYTREAIESGWPDEELRLAAREGRLEDEGWRLRKDGSRFWASVVITALRDENGKLLGFSKVTRDLTERKKHEEALRQSEERFRLLIEGVTDYAVFMIDPQGMVTSWNTGAERIKGYSREEIVGKHFSRFYIERDLESGKPWEELALARRTGRAEDEGWRVRKNGEHFWARVVITALHDSKGRLAGFAKVTQDLTERRHLRDLEKASQNVNEFLGMLAHELRNPLAPIRFAVNVMGKKHGVDPANEKMRQMIDRQSAHLAHIVEDLMDISRVSRGKLHIFRETVNLVDVVNQAIETATPLIASAQHKLQLDVLSDSLPVSGDFHRLTQIVANLLNNAARYSAPGGKITVNARSENGWAVVDVSDTGQGIEPEMIERIFDMFVQGRSPLQRVGSGLGVGLALARRLAELHGGSVVAHSDGVNKGSVFTFRAPLEARTSAADGVGRADAQTALTTTTPRRILVVDDNEDAAVSLGLLLQSLGHETCVVYNGTEAIKMAIAFRPDVVLLDIGMPGISGYEVARRLQALKEQRPMRIIAITGWGQEEDKAKSKEAGFDLHLVKPVDAEQLAQAVGHRTGATLH